MSLHVCFCLCACACTHDCVPACLCACVCVCAHDCVTTCLCVFVCARMRMSPGLHSYLLARVCACMCILTCHMQTACLCDDLQRCPTVSGKRSPRPPHRGISPAPTFTQPSLRLLCRAAILHANNRRHDSDMCWGVCACLCVYAHG